MILQVSNMSLSLDAALPGNEKEARREIARALGVKPAAVGEFRLLKRSVDARKKTNVHFVATYAVELPDDARVRVAKGVNAKPYEPTPPLEIPACADAFAASDEPRPLVVGTGPAGLFCALYLARAGLRPLVVERGADVDARLAAIEAFDAGGPLNTMTNIQFGEGGAGTFSDGKLNTGTKSLHIRHVLEAFVEAGAPEEILWQAKPHIGTDKLIDVVRNIRQSIIAAGGEVRFETMLESVRFEGGRVAGAVLRDVRTGAVEDLPVTRIVLACGHSARDTFQMIHDEGLLMQRKPFAVGVRIEHPQQLIDESQYGSAAQHPALGAADYKLAVHTKQGRGVYTFCMCPGGLVVAATSEEGGVCVNGMSRFARDERNANSALLVGIEPEDFPGDDVLAGVAFQRQIERAAYDVAFAATGVSYAAPVQTVGDFLAAGQGDSPAPQARVAGSHLVKPSYPRAHAWCDLHECLPSFVTDAMEEALPMLDRKLAGFAHPEAVMTGVEARSSSPVRIVRDDSFQAQWALAGEGSSAEATGLYPCGEGAGYAGGITSAAVDGLRVAEALAASFVK